MACIFCQSKSHDYRSCPVQFVAQRKLLLSSSYVGKSPNVFLGRYGYPHIRVGILGALSYDHHDDPLFWSQAKTPIGDIVQLRSELVNSTFQSSIKGFNDRFSDVARDVSLAKRPVDVEVSLVERPRLRLSFERDLAPHGPTVGLKQALITENIPIDARVEKAADAQDLSSADAVVSLASKGIDTHFLTKAFSMGNFGLVTERRLVPTRWSITAVDDILGKQKLESLRRLPLSDCLAYFGGHLGNYYLLLFFDEQWQYELFEQFVPSTRDRSVLVSVETDYESFYGRTDYVHETAGGYYAARLGILEHLERAHRQASVLAIRIITEEYSVPLGVWVVRESIRKTLLEKPLRFSDRQAMVSYAQSFLRSRFGYDIVGLLSRSLLLRSLQSQRKLRDY